MRKSPATEGGAPPGNSPSGRLLPAERKKKRRPYLEIIMFFEHTPKTETAFYLRFQQLHEDDKRLVQSYLSLPDSEWGVFKAIVKWWNVRRP